MPSPETILAGLTRIANDFVVLAAAWHGVLAGALLLLATGRWHPTRRAAATWLAIPLVSVSGIAWIAANPVNGAAFAVFAVLLVTFGARLPSERTVRGPAWSVALGIAAIAYAWVYPHFLESRSASTYLMAAPLGLLPCPTTSAVLGFGLIGGGFGSRPWSLTIASAGLLYGLLGTLVLGVWLDAGLLVASIGMLAIALGPWTRASRPPSTAERS